eukprot:COSAG06_NODE_20602_length_788_cov_1.518142_1_plen_181_part_10
MRSAGRSATPPRHREEANSSSSEDDVPPTPTPEALQRRQQLHQHRSKQIPVDAVAATATVLVAPPPLPTRGAAGSKWSSPRLEQGVTPLRAGTAHVQLPVSPSQQHLGPRETLLLEKEVLELKAELVKVSGSVVSLMQTDSLAQLAQLRREGMLSDEEFTHAKQHALQRAGWQEQDNRSSL